MGTWGPGLYANDLAKDVKSTIGSVLKLPLEPTELINLLQDAFPEQSSQERDEEYTSFWLVVADCFHKGGVNEPSLFERAQKIIDSGMDLQYPERQEMPVADQRKREQVLDELRERLTEPPPNKKRKTLSKPQSLVMNAGDLVVYPVYEYGQCINPYSSGWSHGRDQKAWGAAYIVRSGHVFQYLAYYCPLVLASYFALSYKPSTTDLMSTGERKSKRLPLLTQRLEPELSSTVQWELRRPGTCSKLHFQRMQLDIIGHLPVDEKKLVDHFPGTRDGRYQAINDISIADSLGAAPEADATLENLEDIVG